jgi:hypothetical protein
MAFNHAQWLSHITYIGNTLSDAGLPSLFFIYAKSKPNRVISFSVNSVDEMAALNEIKDFMSLGFDIVTVHDGIFTLGGTLYGETIDSITYIELVATNHARFSKETISTLENIFERVDLEMFRHRKLLEQGVPPS